MSKVCEKCGRTYERSSCEYCKREKEWQESRRKKEMEKYFTPRIISDLENLELPQDRIDKLTEKIFNGKSLYFTGAVGSGKTILASAILLNHKRKCWVEQKREDHEFKKMPRLLEEIKKSFNDDSGLDESEIIEKYSQVDFLVLDDFGMGNVSGWYHNTMYLIIDTRYEQLKKTLITSNMTPQEYSARLKGNRVTSRIKSMCTVVNVGNKDRR